MKRVLEWLCLLMALALLPQTAFADIYVSELYFCYRLDGGEWVWNERLPKSGDTYAVTLPAADVEVEWAVSRVRVPGDTDAARLAALTADEAWLQYGSSYDEVFGAGSIYTLFCLRSCGHTNRIASGGIHTLTFLLSGDVDENGYEKMDFTVTTADVGSPAGDEVYNLPLVPGDFINADGSARPHYFLVGTRMGDWRLQPEWELTALGDGRFGIENPRVLYTGLFAFAMVDNYKDYANGNYQLYSHSGSSVYNVYPGRLKVDNLKLRRDFEFYNSDGTMADKPAKSEVCAFLTVFSGVLNLYNDAATERSKGILVKNIALTVDAATGVPASFAMESASGLKRDDYITFSLVGDGIYNEGMENSGATTHNLDLATAGKAPVTGWQEGWVQYNPATGEAYRDARGNLLYQTCFQSEWLEEHPSLFNKRIGSGVDVRDFSYSSRNIVMRNAASFSEEELSDDPYAPLYRRFGGNSGSLGATNVKLLDDKGVVVYDYNEKNLDNNSPYFWLNGSQRKAQWECYVVKDMWISGNFKIWSGWGGGTRWNEYKGDSSGSYGISKGEEADERWYYVNGGHGKENTRKPVEGSDITVKGGDVQLYATTRNRSGADFNVGELTYFKRVIVWCDPGEYDFNNSVIQLCVERLGPNIRAFRGNAGDEIDYVWNVPDLGITDDEKGYEVRSYVITLYRRNDSGGWDEVSRSAGSPSGTYVRDYIGERTGADTGLPGGTYYYTVDFTYTDGFGAEVTRSASSNEVMLYEASRPVTAGAAQRTETAPDGTTLYSFDIVLDLDIKDDMLDTGSGQYRYRDLVADYLIEVPEATAAALNSAMEAGTAAGSLPQAGSGGWFTEQALSVYVDGRAEPEEKTGYWMVVGADSSAPAETITFANLTGAVDGGLYRFDIYLRPKPGFEEIYSRANFGHTSVSVSFHVPGLEVDFEGGGIGICQDSPDRMLCGMDTPGDAMPMGAHDPKGTTLCAPVHYTAANSLYASFSVSGPAVTASVRDNFTLRYSGASSMMPREELPVLEGEGEELFHGITDQAYLDVARLADKVALQADGKEYNIPREGGYVPVVAVADVAYVHARGEIRPAAEAVAEGAVTVDLPAPEVTVDTYLTTNEQDALDGRRYYVHELYANIQLDNIQAVGGGDQNLVVRPGFHLVPSQVHGVEFVNGFGTTDAKASRGGVVAYEGLFGFSNTYFDYLDGYVPWDGDRYDAASNNWALLSARHNTLPVYVDYYAVKEYAEGADYTAGIPALGGYVAYHYPFLLEDPYAGAVPVALQEGGATHRMATLTVVLPLGETIRPDRIATAIGSTEAGAGTDAEFFNLQGIKVDSPASGQVYLVRRGATVEKVLYR